MSFIQSKHTSSRKNRRIAFISVPFSQHEIVPAKAGHSLKRGPEAVRSTATEKVLTMMGTETVLLFRRAGFSRIRENYSAVGFVNT
jgi:hypothetical protein